MALAAMKPASTSIARSRLAVTLEEAERMAAAAERKGVKTLVAFNNIKTPAALLAKQLIERGDIGTPTRFRAWFKFRASSTTRRCPGAGAARARMRVQAHSAISDRTSSASASS